MGIHGLGLLQPAVDLTLRIKPPGWQAQRPQQQHPRRFRIDDQLLGLEMGQPMGGPFGRRQLQVEGEPLHQRSSLRRWLPWIGAPIQLQLVQARALEIHTSLP